MYRTSPDTKPVFGRENEIVIGPVAQKNKQQMVLDVLSSITF